MQGDDLDSLLGEMAAGGSTDSQGVFTISWTRAKEQLAQFALPESRRYVLNLVASAVSSGATFMEVTQTANELNFRHDGKAVTQDQLIGLWNHLLAPRERALEELAVAFNAARTLPGAKVEMWSWEGESGLHLCLEGDLLQVEPALAPTSDGAKQGCLVRIKEAVPLYKAIRWAQGSVESQLLKDRADLAPASLSVGGQKAGRAVRLGTAPTTAAWRQFSYPGVAPRFSAPNPKWSPLCVRSKRKSSADFSAILALGLPDDCQREGLRLILNGVTFTFPASLLGYPVLSGAVWLSHLRKNVSHTELVQDSLYSQLLADLQAKGERLIADRLRHSRPLPAECVEPIARCLPTLIANLESRGEIREAKAAKRWLKEKRLTENLGDRSLWRELLEDLSELEPASSEALALEKRLARLPRASGREKFFAGRMSEAVVLWDRLVELGELRRSAWLEEEKETLMLLRCLAGLEERPDLRPPRQDTALAMRALGRPKEAIEVSKGVSRAEACLAVWDFVNAEELLRELLSRRESPEAAEALSDLLAYAPVRGARRYPEALHWKEVSVALRARDWADVGSFFGADLSRLASKSGFKSQLRYRVRLLAPLPNKVVELNEELEAGRQLNLAGQPGAVTIKSALLAAERRWPPGHVVLVAARVKAVQLLRSAQLWREADDILARGALIASVAGRLETSPRLE